MAVGSHPSSGTRGLLSAPPLVRADADDRLRQRLPRGHRPAARFKSGNGPFRRHSTPSTAFDLSLEGQFRLAIDAAAGPEADSALTVKANGSGMRLTRSVPSMPTLSRAFSMERADDQPVRLLVDHGSIEVVTDDGLSVMTALVFPGPDWSLAVRGSGSIMIIS